MNSQIHQLGAVSMNDSSLFNIIHLMNVAWLFELAGGAVTSFLDTCLPKIQREANFTIAAFHQWEMDDDDPLCVTTAEDVKINWFLLYHKEEAELFLLFLLVDILDFGPCLDRRSNSCRKLHSTLPFFPYPIFAPIFIFR